MKTKNSACFDWLAITNTRLPIVHTSKLLKKLARKETSSISRQQFANMFCDCFCAVHTHQLEFANTTLPTLGCFPLCQRFRKFRSEFKWKGPFRVLPTGIFGITSGGGPLISVGIFRPKLAVPFLTNWFFVLIREFGKGIKGDKLVGLV